jgi:methyltransferase (TIGR00027 family)
VSQAEPAVRNISDTACWAALYRAKETERPDALFRDPLARRLAGTRGEQIAAAIPFSEQHNWTWLTRTYLFDQFLTEQIEQGVDMVVNLAAGLDARPYRMKLPASLQWVEVDLPELLAYKEGILANEKPVCALSRVALDLADGPARRELFERLGRQAKKAVILTEGLIIYLTDEQVGALAEDLARQASFQSWILDLASPALLQMLRKRLQPQLTQGGAVLQFAPEAGPAFFTAHGWNVVEARSLLHTAAQLKRLSFMMRLFALFPDSRGTKPSRPWSGICLAKNTR